MSITTLDRFEAAVDQFDRAIHPVGPDQWQDPTPCSAWDVRALVNHVVGEMAWMPALLAGRTIADVGGELDGDLLGTDPCASWHHWSALAHTAATDPDVMRRTVQLSYGAERAAAYCEQVTADLLVHAWDLLASTGQDDDLPLEPVQWLSGWAAPQLDGFRAAGVFGPPVPVTAGAGPQTRMLAALGRDRPWRR